MRAAAGNAGFVFDDEPIESILFGERSPGPSPAGLYAPAEPPLAEIAGLIARREIDEALRRMGVLLRRGEPPGLMELRFCVAELGRIVPSVPRPIVSATAEPCDALLEVLLAAALARGEALLVDAAGTLLYRWYESAGRYADAARVVRTLLAHAAGDGRRNHEAVLLNNLGYEHYLSREWRQAEACYARAIEIFAALGNSFEHANARVNILLCRSEEAGGPPPKDAAEELTALLPAIGYDWRRRKPLTLLARAAEARGDQRSALAYAREAVVASEGVPTRHREEDLLYCSHLEALLDGAQASGGGDGAMIEQG